MYLCHFLCTSLGGPLFTVARPLFWNTLPYLFTYVILKFLNFLSKFLPFIIVIIVIINILKVA